jgi:hypothetical protein
MGVPPNQAWTTGSCEEQDSIDIRRLFFDSMPKKYVDIENISSVICPRLQRRFLERVAQKATTVEACFHGTKAEFTEDIMRHGLLCSENVVGAYGYGAYVGTHAGVAHQYAVPHPQTGLRHMCVVLVTVGGKVFKGETGILSPRKTTTVDNTRNPTQYCFVEDDRLLVSHLITYRVAESARRRIGGEFEDPLGRALECAVRRAGKEQRTNGLQ